MDWNAQRVRDLRRQTRLNQTDFGERIGVRQATVSAWENGKTTPTGPSAKLLDLVERECNSSAPQSDGPRVDAGVLSR